MNNPALTEDVKTAPPSPKLNRRKRPYGRPLLGRLALRFAALVAAVSALGTAYWFTRPPELVWWRSPEIAETGWHYRALMPCGWEETPPLSTGHTDMWNCRAIFLPVDRRPKFIRWIFSH